MTKAVQIKAGKVSNLTDARFFSSYSVQWLGLNLDPASGKGLSIENAGKITQWLKGPALIGEFSNRSLEEILFISDQLQLAGVELDSGTDASALQAKGLTVFRRIVVGADAIPMGIQETGQQDYILLEIEGPVGDPEDMDKQLKDFVLLICQEYPAFLYVPGREVEMEALIRYFNPEGVQITGDREVKTGFGDFDEIANFLDRIKES